MLMKSSSTNGVPSVVPPQAWQDNKGYARTGLVGYSGPHFSSFGMLKGFSYTEDYFKKCLFSSDPYTLSPAPDWSDDLWFLNQEDRKHHSNQGYLLAQEMEGDFAGKIIGGHLRCLSSLQGTKYWPSLKNSILFMEEDEEISPQLFDRQLQSLIHQADFSSVKAILIGRFQLKSKVSEHQILQMLSTKRELKNTPVIFNADFGHTTPFITFPIGGEALIKIRARKISIEINKH